MHLHAGWQVLDKSRYRALLCLEIRGIFGRLLYFRLPVDYISERSLFYLYSLAGGTGVHGPKEPLLVLIESE